MMAIHTEYRLTIACDTCGKTIRRRTDMPPSALVPEDWVQVAPPGTNQVREFCSAECFQGWQNPIRPWDDDDVEDEVEVVK